VDIHGLWDRTDIDQPYVALFQALGCTGTQYMAKNKAIQEWGAHDSPWLRMGRSKFQDIKTAP
jgi:hypothetical protein